MSRRLLIAIGIVAAGTGAGVGTYALYFRGAPAPDAPVYTDDLTKPLVREPEFEKLAREDPVAMLDQCLSRYTREVKGGARFTVEKQERVQGKPKPPEAPQIEVIEGWVRGEIPDPETKKTQLEILMKWKSPGRKPLGVGAEVLGSLYSEKRKGAGGLDGKVMTWSPDAWLKSQRLGGPLEPNIAVARGQSRYCVRDAGFYRTMLRTHEAWKARQAAGELKVEYLGKKAPPQIGRECHVIRRVCPRTEIDAFELGGTASTDPNVVAEEGFTEVTIYIDTERWLQVGSELYRTEPDGTRVLVGTYYFRDVQLNPSFPPDAFSIEALKK